jgi:hypothetical protein
MKEVSPQPIADPSDERTRNYRVPPMWKAIVGDNGIIGTLERCSEPQDPNNGGRDANIQAFEDEMVNGIMETRKEICKACQKDEHE